MNGFLKIQRSKETEELLKDHSCFILLTQIAYRAKRNNDFSVFNLEIGESLIGDIKSIGLTEQEYRTAKEKLTRWNFATFKGTNRGTIAKIIDKRIFDINSEQNNEQTTNQQRTNNEQTTTNKKERIKEENNIHIPEKFSNNGKFMESWKDFLIVRDRKKAKMTPLAAKKIFKMFGEYSIDECIDMLDKSIMNNWTGVFEPKDKNNRKSLSVLDQNRLFYNEFK